MLPLPSPSVASPHSACNPSTPGTRRKARARTRSSRQGAAQYKSRARGRFFHLSDRTPYLGSYDRRHSQPQPASSCVNLDGASSTVLRHSQQPPCSPSRGPSPGFPRTRSRDHARTNSSRLASVAPSDSQSTETYVGPPIRTRTGSFAGNAVVRDANGPLEASPCTAAPDVS